MYWKVSLGALKGANQYVIIIIVVIVNIYIIVILFTLRTHHIGYITSRVMKNATLNTMKRKSHKCWYLA